jgi:hypothetical protein
LPSDRRDGAEEHYVACPDGRLRWRPPLGRPPEAWSRARTRQRCRPRQSDRCDDADTVECYCRAAGAPRAFRTTCAVGSPKTRSAAAGVALNDTRSSGRRPPADAGAHLGLLFSSQRVLRLRWPRRSQGSRRPLVRPGPPFRSATPSSGCDLEQILCHQEDRVVGRDNTVAFDGHAFQLPRQDGRRSCTGLRVQIRRHLNGEYSIWAGPRRLGRFPAMPERPRDRRTAVRPMEAAGAGDAKGASTAPWKTPSAFSTATTGHCLIKRSDHVSNGSGQDHLSTTFTCGSFTFASRSRRRWPRWTRELRNILAGGCA